MSNPGLENKVKELMELKRMREELEAEICAGAFKVSWKSFVSTRMDTAALKKALPEIAAQFTKQTVSRRFSIS